jgi:hypothetical protein
MLPLRLAKLGNGFFRDSSHSLPRPKPERADCRSGFTPRFEIRRGIKPLLQWETPGAFVSEQFTLRGLRRRRHERHWLQHLRTIIPRTIHQTRNRGRFHFLGGMRDR